MEKEKEKEIKDNIGWFIRTVGHETFIIKILIWIVTVLFGVVLILAAGVAIQSQKLTNVKPLVVYVDRDTGIVETRDFELVDAFNEKRDENEIWIFVSDFMKNLFDYTKFSQVRNLETAYRLCDHSVQEKLKAVFIRDGRPSRVKSDCIGLCEIQSVFIMDFLPDLRVRVVYEKKVVRPGGAVVLGKRIEAVLRIKTVVRSRYNPHGLYITDYRETVLNENIKEI